MPLTVHIRVVCVIDRLQSSSIRRSNTVQRSSDLRIYFFLRERWGCLNTTESFNFKLHCYTIYFRRGASMHENYLTLVKTVWLSRPRCVSCYRSMRLRALNVI